VLRREKMRFWGVLVVIEAGRENVLQDIWAACHRTLSWVKRPQNILVVEHLPRTPYGKLDRRHLTAQLQHLLAAE
jgi:acyl-coenzyme A synthetase/AMP-(fatty) acid ligase